MTIRAGRSPHPWPTTSANLQIVEIWASRARSTEGCWLDGWTATSDLWLDRTEEAWRWPAIGPDLQPMAGSAPAERLRENDGIAFQGSNVLGLGFTLTLEASAES